VKAARRLAARIAFDGREPGVSLEGIRQYLAYLVVRLVIAIAQAVRIETCQRASAVLAIIFNDLLGVRRDLVMDNLRHAFPAMTAHEHRVLARRMWEHLFLFAAEIAHTPRKIHETNWHQYVQVRRNDLFVRTLLDDRPLVLVTGHFGNFELAGYMVGLLGFRTWAVARPLENRHLDQFVGRFRALRGQRLLAKKGDYERIHDILGARGCVSFLVDQYAGRKGCWVEFFGRPASTHKAIALFALARDAPIAVGLCRRIGRPLRYELSLAAVADPRRADAAGGVRELTQWFTHELETGIRRAPEQYWWLHGRWKQKRGRGRAKRLAAKAAARAAAPVEADGESHACGL
jgi:KDO2-lipid IV(A) lauroyltransferase